MMKNVILVIVGLVALVSLFFNLKSFIFPKITNSPSQQSLITSKVTNVVDGDTFDVENGERIRLYEIDAPENPQGCLGTDAKERLEDLILEKNMRYQKIGKDNFGRILGYVFFGKLLVNQIMVEEGLAYFAKGKTQTVYSLAIEKDEEKARSTGRGVWSDLCQTKKEGCVIKGNYRPADNTRIYHTPDCYNYGKITIKPGTSDLWFCNEIEATKAGFLKSRDCP